VRNEKGRGGGISRLDPRMREKRGEKLIPEGKEA